MKHTIYGSIVDSGIVDPEHPERGRAAFLPVERTVLVDEKGYMPLEWVGSGGEMTGEAIQFSGIVHGGEERLTAVFVFQWEDIGVLIHDLMRSAQMAGPDAETSVVLGLSHPEVFDEAIDRSNENLRKRRESGE
jgi:hypothetical protein